MEMFEKYLIFSGFFSNIFASIKKTFDWVVFFSGIILAETQMQISVFEACSRLRFTSKSKGLSK